VNDNEIRRRANIKVEVLTDNYMELDNFIDLNQIVVPTGYQTENNTKFKARALHYGSQNSDFKKNSWILHMDEET